MAITREFDEVFNKQDATAVAALYTEDAVQVAPEGILYGREAIKKNMQTMLQQWHATNHIGKADQVNAIGNNVWKVGEWSCTVQGPDGPMPVKGHFAALYVREGDTWKECMSCYNTTPPPAAPAQKK